MVIRASIKHDCDSITTIHRNITLILKDKFAVFLGTTGTKLCRTLPVRLFFEVLAFSVGNLKESNRSLFPEQDRVT